MWQKTTTLFLISQAISLFGTSLAQYALFWHVTLEYQSGAIMTLYIICGFIPTFLLSPLGGVWADRYDRKKLIMSADGVIAFVTLMLAVAFFFGQKSIVLILVSAALRAIGSAFHQPATGAILPQFVPSDKLTKVNGVSGTIQAAVSLASPAISGVLISKFPLETVFLIDVVTALLAIGILQFFVNVPAHARATASLTSSYFTDMKAGFAYIRTHKYLISFFTYLGILLFLISPAAFLTPLQVALSFGKDVWRLTAIEIAFSGGMMAGGLLISLWGSGFKNRMHTMLLTSFFMGAFTFGLGITQHFWVYIGIMVLFGLSLPFFNTPAAVLIQEHVEPEYLGRVFSVNTMLFSSAMPCGMLLFGPLAEVVKIELLLIITGVFMLLLTVVASRFKLLVDAGIAITKSHS